MTGSEEPPYLEHYPIEEMPALQQAPVRWLNVVEVNPGESLTSFLFRQAEWWSVSLKYLMREVDSSIFRTTPDFDVQLPERLLSRIAWNMDRRIDTVTPMTFGPVIHNLFPPEEIVKLGGRWNASHLPWILPAGWFLRRGQKPRAVGGIPYCPQCLMENGVLHSPLSHRLAFVTCCPKHKVWLLDRCPTCETRAAQPVTKIWAEREASILGIRCEACLPQLPTRSPRVEPADPACLRLQTAIWGGLHSGQITIPQLGVFPSVAFLAGLKIVLSATTWLREQGINLPPKRVPRIFPPNPRSTGSHDRRFEHASLLNRITRLVGAAWIIEEPLNRWPLLPELCGWPTSLPRSWKHPWEGFDGSGQVIKRGPWARGHSPSGKGRDEATMRAFFDLVEGIDLHPIRVGALLGDVSSRQYQHWRNRPSTRIPTECARRMEYFLRIWEALNQFLSARSAAREWLVTPKRIPPFDGSAPIDALSGPGTLHKFEAILSMLGCDSKATGQQPEPPK